MKWQLHCIAAFYLFNFTKAILLFVFYDSKRVGISIMHFVLHVSTVHIYDIVLIVIIFTIACTIGSICTFSVPLLFINILLVFNAVVYGTQCKDNLV